MSQRDPVPGDYVRRLMKTFDAFYLLLEIALPLRREEVRPVQLLAKGYSYNSMFEKLFVSDKQLTQRRTIDTKFDTHNRKQVVTVAQRFGLVRKINSIFQHIYGDLLLSFELWLALFREGCAAFDTVFAVAQHAK